MVVGMRFLKYFRDRTGERVADENEAPRSSPLEAIERLREGNRRFVSDVRGRGPLIDHARRHELLAGQEPLAVILGCSDSRVPPEIIFDQGLGDLFVVRGAGNIVAPSQVGSIELAATRFGVNLVIVLGHSVCGAVQLTLEELERPTVGLSSNLAAIVEHIRPSVAALLDSETPGDRADLVKRAVRANIRVSVNYLRQDSAVLNELIRTRGLVVVAAKYSHDTGVVDFFDGLPESE